MKHSTRDSKGRFVKRTWDKIPVYRPDAFVEQKNKKENYDDNILWFSLGLAVGLIALLFFKMYNPC